jgi:hypothetical protein
MRKVVVAFPNIVNTNKKPNIDKMYTWHELRGYSFKLGREDNAGEEVGGAVRDITFFTGGGGEGGEREIENLRFGKFRGSAHSSFSFFVFF